VLSKQKTLLPEYGGSLELSREWARSILKRLNFRKRKATKGVKHLPEDFEKNQTLIPRSYCKGKQHS